VLLNDGRLVQGLDEPILPLLESLRQGDAAVSGRELVHLAQVLEMTHDARHRIATSEAECPGLEDLRASVPDVDSLRRRINKTLNQRGGVRDNASPALAALRRQSRRIRDGLYKNLQETASRHEEHLSEKTVSLKDGRLMLLLHAGSRGRVKGLVHGRSGTGQSLYFEPLSVVEANNGLQETLEEEETERRRILIELLEEVRGALPDLEAAIELMAELDLLQSMNRFGDLCSGRLAEISDNYSLFLVGARHPLLDPGLAELRESALGQAGHVEPVVPLDIELDEKRRLLVITGPNAGGKTVALKTVGLLALAHQCGLPIPAESGTRLPLFSAVVATVGDEQDLLADRSTFSGRLLRLREAWELAGPDSLILLDELGSGTDPDEGAALAVALVEGLLEKGSLAVLTTHLSQLAAMALERPGAACAAMEFDSKTGRPTYRLRPGAPGSSEALALARRLGLPSSLLERAEELLGPEHRNLQRLLQEVEVVRRQLADEQTLQERKRAALEDELDELSEQREALEEERRRLGTRLKEELDSFRRKVRGQLQAEFEIMRQQLEAGRKKGLPAASVERLFQTAPVVEHGSQTADQPIAVGDEVRHSSLGWVGTLRQIRDTQAEVVVRGKRFRCELEDLAPVTGSESDVADSTPAVRLHREVEEGTELDKELNLIGWRVEAALDELDSYLDRALLSPHREIRVVHGFGSGRLRRAVREFLRDHPAVSGSRPGRGNEGGDGATVVSMRRS
jgi:DNA mismatch repair protein MutS2